MCWHHITIRADHTKDHNMVENLVFITLGTFFGNRAIHLLFYLLWAWPWQKFFHQRRTIACWAFWVLQLVETVGGLEHPSVLACLDKIQPETLYSLTFAVQILLYIMLNCLFINLQFSSYGPHGLGEVVIDHRFNLFDKIHIPQLLVVPQRL